MKSTQPIGIRTAGDKPVAIRPAAPRHTRAPWLAIAALAGLAAGAPANAGTWAYAPWTNDADSGIDSAFVYKVAVNFNGAAVSVNGVTFEASTLSGANFSIGGGVTGHGPDGNNVTGNSNTLASTFIYDGNPRTVTLTNLTPGTTYETSFFAFAWDSSGRTQRFAAGSDTLDVDQDAYGQNNGIRIYYTFEADAATKDITITPTGNGTFHMSALASHEVVTSPQAKMLSFGLPGMPGVISGTSITMYVPIGTDVTSLGPDFTMSSGATCYQTDPRLSPPPAVVINPFDAFNFTSARHYWVQSSDGLITNDYTVTVTETPAETTVIWNTTSGSWDTSSLNWLGEVSGVPVLFSNGQNVIFNKTSGGTITVAANMAPASTTVNATSGAYTFNGGPISAGSFTKSGGGSLYFNSANTFGGGLTVNAGYVGFKGGKTGAIGTGPLTINGGDIRVEDVGNALVNNNAIFLNENFMTSLNFGNGPVTLAKPITISGGYTFGGSITGPGGLNAFDITYTVPGGWGAGWECKAPVTLRGTQTVQINGWGPMWSALTISGSIDDGGNGYGLNVNSGSNAARLWLNAANTFSGDTTVGAVTSGGYVGVGMGHNLALQNSALVLNRPYSAAIGNGVKTPTIGGLKGTEPLVTALAAASYAWQDSYYNAVTSLTLNPGDGKTCTYTGAIADGAAGMTLVKTGAGTQELGGANTYTGNTSVDAGKLTLLEGGSLTFKVTNSASNKLTGTGTVELNGVFVFDRSTISVTTGSWTIVDATNVTYGPTFSVSGFTKDGSVWKLGGWTFTPASGLLTYAPVALITDFSWNNGSATFTGVINQDAKTIAMGPLPNGTDLSALNPVFTLNSGTCNQTSGSPPSPTFAEANPVTYSVTDGPVVNNYVVTVIVAPGNPNGVADLALWLDAGATYSLSLAGTSVTEWRDARGTSSKATTKAGTPTVVASGIGSRPTMHFDNSSWMNDGVNHAAPCTILYVARQTGGANNRVLGASSNNWLMGFHGGYFNRFYFDGWVYGEPGNATIQSNTNPHLLAATIGGSGKPSSVYAEGALLASNTNGTTGPNNLELNGYSSGSELSNCDISEVLVYNRVLSSTELNAVGSYLAIKYGLTTSYPAAGTAQILNMTVPGGTCEIDQTAKTIVLTVPYTPWNGTGLSTLAPTYYLSSGTCDQTNGAPPTPAFGGTSPVIYTVTDGAVMNSYTVTVNLTTPNTAAEMSNIYFPGLGYAHPVDATPTGYLLQVPHGTPVNALSPTYVMSAFATGDPASGTERNFTSSQNYRITAEDGVTTRDYSVSVANWAGYAARVIASNPYGYWPMNEGKGLVAYNNSCWINGGYSTTGTTYLVEGPEGPGGQTGVQFSGGGGIGMRVPWNSDLNPDTSFSVELWVKPTAIGGALGYVASSANMYGNREGWYLAQDSGGTFGTGTNSFVVRMFNRNGTNRACQLWTPITEVKWYHLVLTWNSDTKQARLYTDGTTNDIDQKGVATLASYYGEYNLHDPMTVGIRSDSNFAWPGSAAHLAFYKRTLTATEIANHFTGPATLSYTDWASTKYPAANLTDPAADLDGDGVSNFGEYAFGLNPTTGSSVNPIISTLQKGTRMFTYTRTQNTGLVYTVWTSPDLNNWTQDAAATQMPGTASDGVEPVDVTLSANPLPDTLFVQVRAQ